ncbi:hypothetical protein BDR04DRAFT_1175689 [Suillus decipiens]|nr:hypothetical protein BDR04DRAFT_1175689 [Suillus decipiens]
MGRGNSSRNLTREIETTVRESSHRPCGRVCRFLEKVKDCVKKLRSRSNGSPARARRLAPPYLHPTTE